MTTYETPGCAYCPSTVRACRQGEGDERGPGFCPSKIEPEAILEADAYQRDPFLERVAKVAAVVESEGYCEWTPGHGWCCCPTSGVPRESPI